MKIRRKQIHSKTEYFPPKLLNYPQYILQSQQLRYPMSKALSNLIGPFVPEPDQVHIRDSINLLIRGFYFLHLIVMVIYSLMLLIIERALLSVKPYMTTLIYTYGFLLLWILLFNFIAILLNRRFLAVWCVRVVAKIVIVVFPIWALIGYKTDMIPFTQRSILVFVVWNIIVAMLMILYELYTCTCGHHNHPGYLFEENQLDGHRQNIDKIKKQYSEMKATRNSEIQQR